MYSKGITGEDQPPAYDADVHVSDYRRGSLLIEGRKKGNEMGLLLVNESTMIDITNIRCKFEISFTSSCVPHVAACDCLPQWGRSENRRVGMIIRAVCLFILFSRLARPALRSSCRPC